MKPTILFILHLPPPIHGAAMMGKYIHESKLINESFDCLYINLTTARNLEDIGHFRVGKIIEFLKLLHRIRKKIRQLRPNLVYVTPNAKGGAFYKDFVVIEMIKTMGCKVIVHYHNKGVATRQSHWLDDKLYRKFFNGIKVILLAEALYPDVQKYVRREDVYICPNGIPDTTRGKEPIAERHNKIPHLLFLSNLLVSKGVIVLLDALKILKERGYSFVCDFVGGETAEIDAARFNEEVEKRGLNKLAIYDGKKYGEDKDVFVFYWGKKYGQDKDAFLRNADIFVFPTYYPNECFPLVLLEAMQQGLPCISTPEGAISSIIEDGKTGLLVKRQDANDLSKKIAWMIEHITERKIMGRNGLERYRGLFTIEKFESGMNSILLKEI